jgi:sortase (surface protein transpeptidase)
MPTPTTSGRPRRPFVALLAVVLSAVAATTAGVAMASPARPDPVPPVVGAGAVQQAIAVRPQPATTSPALTVLSAADLRQEHRVVPVPAPQAADTWIDRPVESAPAPKARAETKGGATTTSGAPLSGRNKVWIPALGIRTGVTGFACSSNAYPGNRVYRWGCAGKNNVYLFGHAYSVFKPLHDAYVRGRLQKGMRVMYADGAGRVSTYKVIWWKITTPDKGAFAYAAQSRPSMTLQTCVGARSQYRLIVRLSRVG